MRTGKLAALRRFAVVPLIAASLGLTPAAAHADEGPYCQQVTLPVTVAPGDPVTYHVTGQLCAEGTWQGKTVQLLTAGGSYDHNYWSFPYQPETYSYTRWATSQGFATFDIDRLGTGQSDYPPAPLVNTVTSAYVEHQIVQALRTGAVGGYAFGSVILVGHSFGSMVSVLEASTYHDVDGVVATGFLHALNPAGFAEVGGTFVPAPGAPPGYITTAPGARGPDFYDQSAADPAVVALDDGLKSADSSATLADMPVAFDPAVSRAITVPVLLVVGVRDKLFCDAAVPGLSCGTPADVLAREALDYTQQACLQAVVQPDSGHSIALHPNASDGFRAMTGWARRYVSAPIQPSRRCGHAS